MDLQYLDYGAEGRCLGTKMFIGTNTTGWAQLMGGDLVGAAYSMYNASFAGLFIIALFLVYQFMLYLKVRNLTLNFVTGIIFGSLFISAQLIPGLALPILAFILIMEFALILITWFIS